jgi:hypothetical protein
VRVLGLIFPVVFTAVWPPLWGAAYARILRALGALGSSTFRNAIFRTWAICGIVMGVTYFCFTMWMDGGTALGSGLVGAFLWWWRKRKRRNVLAMLGAKSRALRDALVKRARQATRPSPVLRPSLRGAS